MITCVGDSWTVRTMGLVAFGTYVVAIPMVLSCSFHASGKRRAFFDVQALKELPFLTLVIGGFFRFLGYFTPVFFIPTFVQMALKTSQVTSLNLLIIYNASSSAGRIGGSAVSMRTLVMAPWMFCSTAAGVLCLIWTAVHNLGGFVTFIVIYGIISGPLTVFPPNVLPLLCPSPKVISTSMGMLWGSTAFALLIGPQSPQQSRILQKDTFSASNFSVDSHCSLEQVSCGHYGDKFYINKRLMQTKEARPRPLPSSES